MKMELREAREIAAQAWCDNSTSHLDMVPELAEAFAKILVEEVGIARAASAPEDWKSLTDVQWMNIVNLNHAWRNVDKEDAINEVVKLVEAKCKANNLAMAEQNEKMRSFLEFAWKDIPMSEYAFEILEHVMNLPNLATPVLNKIKAEAYREAALYCESRNSNREYPYACYDQGYDDAASDCSEAIRAKADELEKQNG